MFAHVKQFPRWILSVYSRNPDLKRIVQIYTHYLTTAKRGCDLAIEGAPSAAYTLCVPFCAMRVLSQNWLAKVFTRLCSLCSNLFDFSFAGLSSVGYRDVHVIGYHVSWDWRTFLVVWKWGGALTLIRVEGPKRDGAGDGICRNCRFAHHSGTRIQHTF